MKKLSVIIPAYNEEKSIGILIDQALHAALPQDWTLEIVVVDDGSTDGTMRELMKFSQFPNVLIIHQSPNQGKTAGVAIGIKNATGDYVIIQDADLEYDPSHYQLLLGPILTGESQVVFGSRWLGSIRQMAWINRLANRFSTFTVNCLYGVELTDIFTCFKIFPRNLFDQIQIRSNQFQFDGEVPAKVLRLGYSIKELPIDYAARSRKEGKKINWRSAIAMYWALWYYRFSDG